MNKTFRSIWNAKKQTYVAVAEIVSTGGKRSSSSVALLFSPLVLIALAGSATAADLPTGGQLVTGSGSIATNGNTMTVNQSSNKMAVDWQSFSIGQNNTMEFVQPSSSAVALNRVLGTDVSVIQGALKANGQVFLVNPNGVMFTKNAQVNVGGLLASTLNIKTEDFIAGNYHFEGGSSNAIVNQGNITAAPNGTIALIAAKISNVGQINGEAGNVLIGAGSKVKLDLGGPVKIEVEQGAIDALIEQGGGIRADGGLVYLTAKALGELTSTVINHTGITEAKTLATGEKGQIVLIGGMNKDRIVVGGKLDASAPNGGDGGFIETSSAHVSFNKDLQISTAAPHGKLGTWLIDPVDFTIAASGGDLTGSQLSSALQAANVTIDTTAAATQVYSADNSLTGSNGNGDIFVKDTITPNLTALRTLTLKAGGAINFGSGVSGEEGIITASGNKLNVYLSAGNDGISNGVTFNTGSSITTNGGDLLIGGQLDVNGRPSDSAGEIHINQSNLNAGTGNIDIKGDYIKINGEDEQWTPNPAWDNNDPTTQYDVLTPAPSHEIKAANVSIEAMNSDQLYTEGDIGSLKIEGSNSLTLKGQSIEMNGTDLKTSGTLTLDSQEDIYMWQSSIDVAASGQTIINADQAMTVSAIDATDTTGDGENKYHLFDFDYEHEWGDVRVYLEHSFANLHGGNVTVKWGSDATPITITPKLFNNALLAFGNGLQDSINASGMLRQPFYYSPETGHWVALTYDTYPMDVNIGIDGTGYSDGTIVNSNDNASQFTNSRIDYSGLSNGTGTVSATNDVVINGKTLELTNVYTLNPNQKILRSDTTVKNISGSSVDNIRIWAGNRDDNVGEDDSPTKVKGNLSANDFNPITQQSEQAKAILIYRQDNAGIEPSAPTILFYSTSPTADTTIADCCDPNWEYDNNGNILASPRDTDMTIVDEDGNYSVTANYGSLANNSQSALTWFYGASSYSDIGTVTNQAYISGGGGVPSTNPEQPPLLNAVTNVQASATQPHINLGSFSNTGFAWQSQIGSNNRNTVQSGGLMLIQGEDLPASSNASDSTEIKAGRDIAGFMNVFVARGGINSNFAQGGKNR